MHTAREIMVSNVVTAKPGDTMRQAVDWMCMHSVSGLPVVDEDRRLLGLVTEFAVLEILYDPRVADLPVERCMTKEVITVEPDAPITDAASKIVLHRIRRVLVAERGKLLGLISRRDLVRVAHSINVGVSTIADSAAHGEELV